MRVIAGRKNFMNWMRRCRWAFGSFAPVILATPHETTNSADTPMNESVCVTSLVLKRGAMHPAPGSIALKSNVRNSKEKTRLWKTAGNCCAPSVFAVGYDQDDRLEPAGGATKRRKCAGQPIRGDEAQGGGRRLTLG